MKLASSLLLIGFEFQYMISTCAFTMAKSPVKMETSATKLFQYDKDTDVVLPSFETKEEYTNYLMESSALPKYLLSGVPCSSLIAPVRSLLLLFHSSWRESSALLKLENSETSVFTLQVMEPNCAFTSSSQDFKPIV